MLDTNGVEIHSVTNQIGFRTITFVNGSGFYVNGKKGYCVKLSAVTKFWRTTGRTISRALCDSDLQLIKDIEP